MAGKEQIAAKILETGGGLKVRGALNPVLWLYALTSSSMLSGAIFVPQYALLFITALLIVLAVALSSFIYLLFRNPDRLQSEEYQIRKRSMEIMQEISEHSASELSEAFKEAIGHSSGRFLFSEITRNKQGWLTSKAWHLINKKTHKPKNN